MKKSQLIVCLMIVMYSQSCIAQSGSTPFGGAILYSMPIPITSLPLYSGQPNDVSSAYLLFQHELEESNYSGTDHFFERLGYGDTSKYIANLLYRVTDDNPLSFFQWLSGSKLPYNYQCPPSYALYALKKSVARIYNDTLRTYALLNADIIAHVRVSDTLMKINPNAYIAKRVVGVTGQIIESIKGKYVPACPLSLGVVPKDKRTLYVPAVPTYAVLADSGTCLQFQYSLDWGKKPQYDDIYYPDSLIDFNGGTWIKPDSEYVVLLKLVGANRDSLNHYFTIESAGPFGSCASMYPVHNGIVYDPNDDFGLGSNALIVDEWKSRLRTRIHFLTHP